MAYGVRRSVAGGVSSVGKGARLERNYLCDLGWRGCLGGDGAKCPVEGRVDGAKCPVAPLMT